MPTLFAGIEATAAGASRETVFIRSGVDRATDNGLSFTGYLEMGFDCWGKIL
jgi:hypothetical protein